MIFVKKRITVVLGWFTNALFEFLKIIIHCTNILWKVFELLFLNTCHILLFMQMNLNQFSIHGLSLPIKYNYRKMITEAITTENSNRTESLISPNKLVVPNKKNFFCQINFHRLLQHPSLSPPARPTIQSILEQTPTPVTMSHWHFWHTISEGAPTIFNVPTTATARFRSNLSHQQ